MEYVQVVLTKCIDCIGIGTWFGRFHFSFGSNLLRMIIASETVVSWNIDYANSTSIMTYGNEICVYVNRPIIRYVFVVLELECLAKLDLKHIGE